MDIEVTLKDPSSGRLEKYMVGGLRGFMHAAELWIDRHSEGCPLTEFSAKFVNSKETKSKKEVFDGTAETP